MIPYWELSNNVRSMFGVFSIFLLIVAAYISVTAASIHLKKGYLLAVNILFVIVIFIVQGIDDVNVQLRDGIPFTFISEAIGRLPYLMLALILAALSVCEILALRFLGERRKPALTPGAIKESMDALPDGICFFDRDGQPLLVNVQMNRLSSMLYDSELLNAERFWNNLKSGKGKRDTVLIRTDPTVMIRTRDGKVWDFRRKILMIGRVKIHELAAYDVTGEYCLGRELEKRNQRLGEINGRLRAYSLEVNRITREEEILNAKIRIHDDVGRSLLAFRSFLVQPRERLDRGRLLLLWKNIVTALRNEVFSPEQSSGWEQLQKAAEALDVEMVLDGKLPEGKGCREILITALHECLTNTVKHAHGSRIFLSIRKDETGVTAELCNDGKPPSDEVKETGGLLNLRFAVECAGGKMSIESKPRFILRIRLPKGENADEKNKSNDCG